MKRKLVLTVLLSLSVSALYGCKGKDENLAKDINEAFEELDEDVNIESDEDITKEESNSDLSEDLNAAFDELAKDVKINESQDSQAETVTSVENEDLAEDVNIEATTETSSITADNIEISTDCTLEERIAYYDTLYDKNEDLIIQNDDYVSVDFQPLYAESNIDETVIIDGVTYTLPFKGSELIDNGWKYQPPLTMPDTTYVEAQDTSHTAYYNKDGVELVTAMCNQTDSDCEFTDAYVFALQAPVDSDIVKLGSGIGIGSTMEETLDIYKNPYYITLSGNPSSDDFDEQFAYFEEKGSILCKSLFINFEKGVVTGISIDADIYN